MSLLDDALSGTVRQQRCQTCRLVATFDGGTLSEWGEAVAAVKDGRVQVKALHRAMQTRWPAAELPASASSVSRHIKECDQA